MSSGFRRRSRTTEAIVLKRSHYGEYDRVVTLLTKDQGKIACLAKGVRKLHSSKSSALEPGNLVRCQLIDTVAMPLLSQATLIEDASRARHSLAKLCQLVQLLEIVDALFVEGAEDERLFTAVLAIRAEVVADGPTNGRIHGLLERLIQDLGYQSPDPERYPTMLSYVAHVADKPMRSWEYLQVQN